MNNDHPRSIRLDEYRPPDYRIDEVALVFDLEEEVTRVEARLKVRSVHDRGNGARPLVLDADELSVVAVALDGQALGADDYRTEDDCLTLESPPPAFELTIHTEIRPRDNTKLEGLYVSNGTFCTQCEAEGFRRITCFLDRPDVMAVYTTTLRAERARYPVLLSNGNLIEEGDLGDGRHYAVWHDPHPKPSYLFALVAGDLACVEDRFTTASGRPVRLRIFVEHGNEDRCGYAMDALKRSMRWDEKRFGLEYDLDLFNIVAVGDFNMGAMENKSLNIFNSKLILAKPETASDGDYALIEAVVAHEYFHNWTGNRVTCRDWFQLSLKEGLTVFRDQEFSADMRSRAVKRIQDVRLLRARQFPEDSGPLAHPVRPDSYIEINNFYTATVYEKGAEVIRMIHTLLGDAGFRKGMDLYFERHDGQAVTCDDFVAAMADANDVDLDRFKLWYQQAGTPKVEVSWTHDPGSATWELTASQSVPPTPGQPEKAPMQLPLALGLLDREGRELPLRLAGEPADATATTRVLQLTEARQSFRFVDVPESPVPSLNRGFAAPIKLEAPLGNDELGFLMSHDGDLFSRWEAGQKYATRLLLEMVRHIQRGEAPRADDRFIAALGRSLDDAGLDKALAAQVLNLPSEDYLGEQMTVVHVEAIHEAREALRRSIAADLREPLLATYRANASNEPYAPDAASAGRRALRNGCLAYLACLEEPATVELAAAHYRNADNMTDMMAALQALTDIDCPERRQTLEAFYQRFQDDPLVVDKWFALQATSALPDTLDQVKALTRHQAFSLKNPNKVRALIGAFAGGNPLRFHAADGSGYAFLAERVLELDRINPQVAARMLAPLGRWRRFDEGRQHAMRRELQRILKVPDLSRDAYEIASKSLA